MPQLAPGDRLGPYEIVAPVGKGGMGEVFKGRDTRLNRDVAIKTSSRQFSERFEREAKAIAALNHPNICTLYDVGPNFLVMEFVDGAPIKGPVPLETVLAYARQISSALEAAHERAITHRDLKPGNIMVTPAGVIKVLDFGLAKIGQPERSLDPDLSPTLTIGATVAGTILGTAAYMAPEQARGKEVDRRADIWAFGVILHELLTGERLFKGEDLTETLAAVVMREPDLTQVPHEVRRLLKKCLQKDPAKRLRDIADVWDYLDGPAVEPVAAIQQPASKLPWVAAGALGLALLGLGGWALRRPTVTATDAQVMRFVIPPAEGTVLTARNSGSTQQSISPDGHYIAYVAEDTASGGQGQVLWVRAVDSAEAQKLDKTEGAFQPFWSPDSKHIAYFADNKLKRVPFSGGSPLNICDVADAGGAQGGTWFKNAEGGADGVILFVPDSGQGVFRVPATGGVPAPVTKLQDGETAHLSPQMLPDGKRFLYFARAGKKPGIYIQELASDQRTFLVETPGRAAFAPPDLLLYMRDDTLLAQHWDWSALKPVSEPVLVADQLRYGGNNGRSSFSVSSTGVLVYRQGGSGGSNFQFRWFTRDGKPDGDATKLGSWGDIDPSPDGRRALLRSANGMELLDLTSGILSSLTAEQANRTDPVWAPDGRRIAYGRTDGFYQMVLGSGKSTLFYSGPERFMEAWTKEGLLLRDESNKLSLLPAPEENATGPLTAKPRPLGEITGDQFHLSPDEKWIAYSAPSQGNQEVWVAAYPSLTDRRKMAEGMMPFWRADGRELFFRSGVDLVSVDVKQGTGMELGAPKPLLRGVVSALNSTQSQRYVPSPDGKRFLLRVNAGDDSTAIEPLHVTLNWPSLVK